jgi:hypothetical protein
MSDKLTVNFREVVRHGEDPQRQTTALERAVKEAFQRVERWLNSNAPAKPRSPFVLNVWAGPGQFQSENCQVHAIEATEPFAFVLPPHQKDLVIAVMDIRGNASVNTITLKRAGGHGAIMGLSADYVINTDNGYVWLISDGREGDLGNWFVMARG